MNKDTNRNRNSVPNPNQNPNRRPNPNRAPSPNRPPRRDEKVGYFSNEQKQTLKLVGVLSVGVIVLLVLAIMLMNSFTTPTVNNEPKYIDIDNIEGMNVNEAIEILKNAEITYEIIPTDSKIPNKVEKLEYVGLVLSDTGRLRIRVGTSVKVYANVVDKSKIIYLTFDDGPTLNNTDAILEALNSRGIKATFFVQGWNVDRYPEKIAATVDGGHLVGCHSYSHEIVEIYSSTDAFIAEIERYEDAMKSAIGEDKFNSMSKVIRFPGGTTTNSCLTFVTVKDYLAAVREKNYKVYDWTALTGDAERKKTAEEFIEYMSSGLASAKENNKPLIVLLHDKWSTKDAIDDLLDYLVSEGYYFDTIDNCAEYTFAEN